MIFLKLFFEYLNFFFTSVWMFWHICWGYFPFNIDLFKELSKSYFTDILDPP